MVSLLVWAALTTVVTAGVGARPRVLVLPVAAGTASPDLAGELDEAVLGEARALRRSTVLAPSEVAPAPAPCASLACAVEAGRAAGADQVVWGELHATADGTSLALVRASAANGTELGRTSDRVPLGAEAMLLERVPAVVGRLFGESVEDMLSASGAPQPRAAAPALAPSAAPAPSDEGGAARPVKLSLRLLGGAGLAVAGAVVLVAVVGLGATAGSMLYAYREEFAGGEAPGVPALGVYAVVAAGGMATLLLALLAAGASSASLASSFLLP